MHEFDGLLPPELPTAQRGRPPVRHLVVVLPGIGGSALRRTDGTPLWAADPAVVSRPWRNVAALAENAERLVEPDYDDQVRAYDLLTLPIPGLTRMFGGYRNLRRALLREFALDADLTYLEFPYDWRRPVAQNAARLRETIDRRLPLVRARYAGAQVILIGHSMGGLVAREYLEHLGGHAVVRKLITLGTPFRGSVKALDFLCNGPKVSILRFRSYAEHLGRVPALYELLPIYPVVRDLADPAGPLRTVADVAGTLPELDSRRIGDAAGFLGRLNESALPLRTHPIVGFGAVTVQQATLDGAAVTAGTGAPAGHPADGGDGTVPMVAAWPRSTERLGQIPAYDNQTHGGLVTGRTSLAALTESLRTALHDGPVLGPGDLPAAAAPDLGLRPAVSVDVADFYGLAEPVRIAGQARNWPHGRQIWMRYGQTRVPSRVPVGDDGGFALDLGPLGEGVHRLELLDAPDGGILLSDAVEVG